MTTITAMQTYSRIPEGWTLKNYKEIKSMSEETRCFTASIYVAGRKIGEASNHGHGGPNMYHFPDPRDDAMAREAGNEYDPSKYGGLDTLVDDMVEELLMVRQAKRDAKKGLPVTVFVKSGRTEAPRHESMGGGTFVYFQSEFTVAMSNIDQLPELLAKYEADEYQIITQ